VRVNQLDGEGSVGQQLVLLGWLRKEPYSLLIVVDVCVLRLKLTASETHVWYGSVHILEGEEEVDVEVREGGEEGIGRSTIAMAEALRLCPIVVREFGDV
jgi:hypothetical protein